MRIAQVAPLMEAVPPKLYGGTERVVSYLTEELQALGHEVTLFATGDSRTAARLVPICPGALRLNPLVRDPLAAHFVMLERVLQLSEQFDVMHFHLDYLPFPYIRRFGLPALTTLHGRLDLPELVPLYDEFADMAVVSISDAQRRPLPGAGWIGTVHHGLPPDLLRPTGQPQGHLAFLGRISPEKGPDAAIRVARRAGQRLRMAAKVDKVDRDYFEQVVEPMLIDSDVEFVGEIDEAEKSAFLGSADGVLFLGDWPEPFGLVLIEAMACGTPVIAYRRGSVPEIVEDGVTGIIVDDEAGAAAAVSRLGMFDRAAIRRRFEDRFSARRMALDYLSLYRMMARGDAPRLEAV